MKRKFASAVLSPLLLVFCAVPALAAGVGGIEKTRAYDGRFTDIAGKWHEGYITDPPIQQREKVLPSALEDLFHLFTAKSRCVERYRGYRLLAVDGSDLRMPANADDSVSYFKNNAEDAKGYNLIQTIFPTDDAIRKVIYMTVMEISKKWTMPVRDWRLAYAQFSVYFED